MKKLRGSFAAKLVAVIALCALVVICVLAAVGTAYLSDSDAYSMDLKQAEERAIENQAYVLAVNNVSADGTYIGNSQVIAPDGKCIVKAEAKKEQVVSAEVSASVVEKIRKEFPIF